jgi:hypothetical protein
MASTERIPVPLGSPTESIQATTTILQTTSDFGRQCGFGKNNYCILLIFVLCMPLGGYTAPRLRKHGAATGLFCGSYLVSGAFSWNGSNLMTTFLAGFSVTSLSCLKIASITPLDRCRDPAVNIDILSIFRSNHSYQPY